MSFYEWKHIDLEIYVCFKNKKICETSLYDKRFQCFRTERKLLSGMTGASYLPQNTPVIINCVDEAKKLEILCNLYFKIEPQAIPMTNKIICDQRKESFDEWLESKILNKGRSSTITTTNSVEFIHLRDTNDSENSLRVLSTNLNLPESLHDAYLKMFLSIDCYDTTFISCIPLPIILGRAEYNYITEQWLLVISWWKKIAHRLRPLTIRFRDTYNKAVMSHDRKSSSAAKWIKSERLLRKLKRVLRDCRHQQKELFLQQDMESRAHVYELPPYYDTENIELQDSYEETLLETQRVIKHKEMVEELIVFTTKVTSETVAYLLKMQKVRKDQAKYDERLRNLVAQELRVLNGKTRHLHRRKSRVSTGDHENTVSILLVSIGNSLKSIKEKVSQQNDLKTNEMERFGAALRNGHQLLEMIIEACNSVALDILYTHYKMKVKREFISTLLRQYYSQMIQFSMRSIVAKRNKQTVNEADCRDRLQVVSKHIYESALLTIQQILESCIPVVKPTSSSTTTDLPNYIVYEDFPRYLKEFQKLFNLCPHPLEDIDGLTECRLLRIKADFLRIFENNAHNIMELFKMAEDCVSIFKLVSTSQMGSDSD